MKVQGYRSLFDQTEYAQDWSGAPPFVDFDEVPGVAIDVENLTVLIGCNDSGKSSLLDILETVLQSKSPNPTDYHVPLQTQDKSGSDQPNPVQYIYVVLQFEVESNRDEEAKLYAIEDIITICAVYSADADRIYYLGSVPVDSRLRVDFAALTAVNQIALIESIDASALEDLRNKDQRAAWLMKFTESAPKTTEWVSIPRGFRTILPRFERYSAMDYNDPANLIMKTLRQVYESVIFEDEEIEGATTKRPIEVLRDLTSTVEARINDRVQELLSYLQRYNPQVRAISFDPSIDFTGGLRAGQFQIDDGRGPKYLSNLGDGTKRRTFIAVVDWDREIAIAELIGATHLPAIIRGYDEPDTNLDYIAQRTMFRSLHDIVFAKDSRTQALVCTHSPRLVDQAPAKSIRLLTWDQGRSSISKLHTDDDPAIESYLSEVARELGLSNTLMFYERCFLLIEGPTEKNALPLLYRTLFGHSPIEDGICIINVESNGAFKQFFKLLSRNRQEICLIFADLDTEDSPAGKKLTKAILRTSNFDQSFIRSHIFYTPSAPIMANGTEFEASFPNEIMVECLEKEWPKNDGNWTIDEIVAMRSIERKKFSEVLRAEVWKATEGGNPWNKPMFGTILGASCPKESIPKEVKDLFEKARCIALG
jgi:energy-coupling factor transporter ATP-binding protein EcfA2